MNLQDTSTLRTSGFVLTRPVILLFRLVDTLRSVLFGPPKSDDSSIYCYIVKYVIMLLGHEQLKLYTFNLVIEIVYFTLF